jgi:hypothetical protein
MRWRSLAGMGLVIGFTGAVSLLTALPAQTAVAAEARLRGDVVGYAAVAPPCRGCEQRRLGNPLVAARSSKVALDDERPGASTEGAWCFRIRSTLATGRMTVVASINGGMADSTLSIDSADWIPSAPDCRRDEIEIRTFRSYVFNGSLVSNAERGIAFSFVALG